MPAALALRALLRAHGACVLQAERDLMRAKAAAAALRGPLARRQGWHGVGLSEAG